MSQESQESSTSEPPGAGWNAHALIVAGVFVLFLASLATWFLTRDLLPHTIRISTGASGGLYYKYAEALQGPLAKELGREVVVMESAGTVENRERILEG